jgi:hypothetical protein
MKEKFNFITSFNQLELEFFYLLLENSVLSIRIFDNEDLKDILKAVLSHNSSLREYEHKNCASNCPLGNRFILIKVGYVEPRKVIFALLKEGEIVP